MTSPVGFHHFAERSPDAIAVVDADDRQWSRGELYALTNQLTRALRHEGLAPGEAIAIIAPNCAEYIAVYHAGLYAGLQVVPVNWHLADDEITFILGDSRARAVVVHEDLGSRRIATILKASAMATLRIAIGQADGFLSLTTFCGSFGSERPEAGTTGRMMAYTSATTGRPKAVLLPPTNRDEALARRVTANRQVGILPEDGNVNLCASMLYHSAPLGGVELALHLGHRVILTKRWEAERLLALIDQHRVTTTFFVPTMFVRLIKLPQAIKERYSTKSLRFVAHGAAPCPPDIKRQMIEWWGEVIWESYGATEVQGTIANTRDWLRYPGTVGRPLPDSDVKILNDAGEELPPNEVGHIYMKPHTGDRFSYKGNPEATQQRYRGDYISAGDFGYVNEDGFLFLCDRSEDLIISSGMNIYPAEIEAALIQHPAVIDCAVIGVPHAVLGSVPKAFVQTGTGVVTGPALKADLLSFVAERIAAAKLPKRIEFVDTLPRDPNGKLFRRRLQDGT